MASSANCLLDDCSRIFPAYAPSLGGNVALLSLFAVLIPMALGMGIRYNTTIFSTSLATGLVLEVMGYIGRILLNSETSNRSSFTVFLIGTIMGPNFISGAMFLVMPHIVAIYGPEFRNWRPSWYLVSLYAFMAASLVLEIAGGIVATTQVSSDAVNAGALALAVGLAIHLVALVIFMGHAGLFAIAVRTRHHILDATYSWVYNSRLFRTFLLGFSAAAFLLVLRTAFRIVVIAEGFESSVAQAEVLFLVFDGAMVFLASGILLALFPGRVFGRSWRETSARRPSSPKPTRHSQPARPARPTRPQPIQLVPTQKSPDIDQMSFKSPHAEHSPRKTYAPPPQRNMVDSEALW